MVIVAGSLGHLMRDRTVVSALLMYLPVPLASLAAIIFDINARGRALPIPRVRFGLSILAAVAGVWTAAPLVGTGAIGKYGPGDTEITLLHWNVLWGGGPYRTEHTWASERLEIMTQDPDIIVLSELPPEEWIRMMTRSMGPGAHSAMTSLVGVFSRWPVRFERRIEFPGGEGMSASVEVRGAPFRLLVVDGVSDPRRSRLPFLNAIAKECQAARDEGRPFDVIAGDFNTPSRSLGFDALAAEGYALAGRSASGWRATFPSWLPVFDIDHIWVGPSLRLRSCRLFSNACSDHRGQFVSLLRDDGKADNSAAR